MANGRDGGGGATAVLAVVVVLLVVIILWVTGVFGGRPAEPDPDVRIELETPETPSPGN
jgi:hypothetical protein